MRHCKSCHLEVDRERCKQYRNSPHGMASRAWYRINARAENKNGKDACYTNIKVNMTKDQFITWAIPKYSEWIVKHPNESPSINRINSHGHYELGNIELLTCSQNSSLIHKSPFNNERFMESIVKKCELHSIDLQEVIDYLTTTKLSKNKKKDSGKLSLT